MNFKNLTFAFLILCCFDVSAQKKHSSRISFELGVNHNDVFKDPILPIVLPIPAYDFTSFRYFPAFGMQASLKYDYFLEDRIYLQSGLFFLHYKTISKRSIEIAKAQQPLVSNPSTEENISNLYYGIPIGLSYKIKRFEFGIGVNLALVRDQILILKDIEGNVIIKNVVSQFKADEILYIYASYKVSNKKFWPFIGLGMEKIKYQNAFYSLHFNIPLINFN